MIIRQIPSADIFLPQNAALIAEYGKECSIPIIGEINPQQQIYAALESAGALRVFGSFEGDEMTGLAIVIVTPNPHYGKKLAVLESLFVKRDRRSSGAGRELMKAAETFGRESDCAVIGYSAPTGSQLEKLLSIHREYHRTNSVFMRPL